MMQDNDLAYLVVNTQLPGSVGHFIPDNVHHFEL